MSHHPFPQVRLTHHKGHSDHVDTQAGLEFFLDSETVVRVALLQRPDEGDWVVQVSGANGSVIEVEQVEANAYLAARAK